MARNFSLEPFHILDGVVLLLVVIAQEMQHAVHHEMRGMVGDRNVPLLGFPLHRLISEHNVADMGLVPCRLRKDSTLVGASLLRHLTIQRLHPGVAGKQDGALRPAVPLYAGEVPHEGRHGGA